jgi:hypothetical protein
MSTYNGHRNWTYWNVALWIANDEKMYRQALACVREYGNSREAARWMVDHLPDRTPDGARYSVANVSAALRGLRD